jgi:hypothetical protein
MAYLVWSGSVVNGASQPILTRILSGGAKGTRTPDPLLAKRVSLFETLPVRWSAVILEFANVRRRTGPAAPIAAQFVTQQRGMLRAATPLVAGSSCCNTRGCVTALNTQRAGCYSATLTPSDRNHHARRQGDRELERAGTPGTPVPGGCPRKSVSFPQVRRYTGTPRTPGTLTGGVRTARNHPQVLQPSRSTTRTPRPSVTQ